MRHDIAALVVITVLAVAVLFAPSAVAEDDVEDCIAIGKAGNQTVFRCEDWETGNICYVNNFGFLLCVEG